MPQKTKILVVDDSQVALQGAAIALEDAGFDVVTLDNPLSVAHVIRKEQPALALIDINMPAVTGDTVASIVSKRVVASTKIVLHSDVSPAELEARARLCGADGFIQKTGDEAEFVRQVKSVLGQH
jgi:DNA-binding response OmpR family regulator